MLPVPNWLVGCKQCKSNRCALKMASKFIEVGGRDPVAEVGLIGDEPVGGRILLNEAIKKK